VRIYNRLYYFLPAVFIIILASCSATKNLPPGDALYTGASVTIRDSLMSGKKKKALRSELSALTRPKPNTKFLGMPVKLFIYNANAKAKRFPGKWLREKLGQPPVLLSNLNLDRNVQVLQSYLQNKGYFNARVRGDTTVKNKKASAEYLVRADGQYKIQKVEFRGDSSVLQQTIRGTMGKTLLHTNDPFDLDIISAERLRIDNHLKENGFYFFNPEFLLVKADTTIGNNGVDLFMTVKPNIPIQAEHVYRIKDVYIYTGYNLATADVDTNRADAKYYRGYYLIDKRNFYKPKMFLQSMTFDPGDVYNRTDHNASISRLISMNIFKFVKNRFEVVPRSDSAQLNAFYYLTRMPKKSLRMEVNYNTKSNNLTGSNITLGWRNRNTFRAGEQFIINATAGFEMQYNGTLQGYNTFRYGLEPTLVFPRFLIPFFNFNTKGGFLPRTTIKIGYDILTKQKFYTLNSFRLSYGYNWKESVKKEHELNPISINYIQPANVTPAFTDSAKWNPALNKTIEKQFILGSEYNYTYTNLLNNKPANGFYFNGGIDLSGNIAGLLTSPNLAAGDTAKLFGAAFDQYTRLQSDFRFYRKLGNSNFIWANRIMVGIGIPYGNSRELPFIKQFFSGGNNSLRGFRSRSVGPGSYRPDTVRAGLLTDQSGDLKLEMNTELRFPIVGIVNGAVFVDAGNIWLWNEDPLKHGGKFTSQFLSQLAVSTGAGVRFDFNFLVLRLDLGFPIRKPYPKGEQWIINQVDVGSSKWRQDNFILNIGIGYPF
jgi:outer membrane protein assembly factor BamA